MRALFIGRFQPFHNGHANVLKWLSDNADKVIVGIGSANASLTFRNPFTVGERIEMIEAAIGHVTTCSIPDTGGQSLLWYPLVRQYCPSFDEIYSNDEYTRLSIEQWGVSVKSTPLFERDKLSGSRIRYMIARNDSTWTELVPSGVVKIMDRIHGVERLMRLARIENILNQ